MIRGLAVVTICFALMALSATAAEATGPHAFLFSLTGSAGDPGTRHPPDGGFDDACGVAVDSHGDIYVADYFHHAIDVFAANGIYLTQIAGIDPLDGPCNLAVGPAGEVYVNNFHRNVVKFVPSAYPPSPTTTYGTPTVIDAGHSTGVALDPTSGTLYVDNHTYIAAYGPAGTPLLDEEGKPLQIGLGSLVEGYGLAVSAFPATEGLLYVADGGDRTVKVFDPAQPSKAATIIDGAGTPQAGFNYLTDAAVAVSATNGHLYVADNLEPHHEAPETVIDEFNPAGAYRGQVEEGLINAEPSALALDKVGNLYATSGNGAGAKLYVFSPAAVGKTLRVIKSGAGQGTVTSSPAGIACGSACEAEYNNNSTVLLSATPQAGSAFAGWSGCKAEPAGKCEVTTTAATEVEADFEVAPPALAAPPAAAVASAVALSAPPPPPPTTTSAPAHRAKAQRRRFRSAARLWRHAHRSKGKSR